jgi:hypothetical protein
MPSRLWLLALLFSLPLVLCAQSESPGRYEVYGGYSYLSNTFNGIPGAHQGLNGWDAAAGFPPWHHLRFKVDVTAYRGTNLGAPQHAFIILAGGQYTWRIRRESVFVEGLMGDGGLNSNWGPNKLPGEAASFAAFAGGGLDTTLSRHLAFRVDGGYLYTNFALILSPADTVPYRIPGLPNNFGRLSTGMVWRF